MPYLKPAFWTVTCTLRLVHSGHLDLSDFMEVNGRPAGEINPARSNVGMANTFQQYACLPAVRSPECSGIITWNTMNTHIKKSSRYFRCSSLQYQPQVCRCQGRSQPSEFHSKARSWQTVGALSCCVLLRKCSMIAKDSTLLQQISMSGTVADSLADWTPKKKSWNSFQIAHFIWMASHCFSCKAFALGCRTTYCQAQQRHQDGGAHGSKTFTTKHFYWTFIVKYSLVTTIYFITVDNENWWIVPD